MSLHTHAQRDGRRRTRIKVTEWKISGYHATLTMSVVVVVIVPKRVVAVRSTDIGRGGEELTVADDVRCIYG